MPHTAATVYKDKLSNVYIVKMKSVSPSLKVVRFLIESRVRMTFQKSRPAMGAWMRNGLSDLGPAYIKLGQFLSTRPDIVGKEVVKELELLQDDIRKVPFHEMSGIIEKSLGLYNIQDVFESIDEIPIASASIGQVHTATLRKRKTKVAIKVQKPGVATQIRDDMNTLKSMIAIIEWVEPLRANEFKSIISQYEAFISAELDFNKELCHMQAFIKILKDANIPVKVPRPIAALSSSKMLVMEYVPSTKINDVVALRAMGVDTAALATTLIKTFLYQIITVSYVHCDPHPGNIGVMDDGTTIVLYDFGNVVRFSSAFKTALNQIVFATYQKDVDEFVNILTELKILKLTSETDVLEAKTFFKYFFDYLSTLDFTSLRESIVTGDLSSTIQTNLKLDQDFFSLFRIFSLLDGTCLKLDPNFSYIDALAPYTDEMMFDMKFIDSRARRDLIKIQAYPSMVQTTDMNITRMKNKMKTMEQSQNQASHLVIVGFVLSNVGEPQVIAVAIGVYVAYMAYTTRK